jgi:hypothetical protein
VELDKLTKALGGDTGDLGAAPAQLGIWIDRQGLTRRLAMTVAMGSLGSMSMNLEFFEFGTKVSVKAPAKDDVVDFTSMFNGLGKSIKTAPSSRLSTTDAQVRSDLRSVASTEETYFTDAMRYGSARQLNRGLYRTYLHKGVTIAIHLNSTRSFCLAGYANSAPKRVWIYASDRGGVRELPTTRDDCSARLYPTSGGQLKF